MLCELDCKKCQLAISTLYLTRVMPKVDWRFASNKILAKVKTSDVYHKLVYAYPWMVEWVDK